MNQQTAEKNLQTWFWTFKDKMVDQFPQYSGTFDYVVGTADSCGVLYECMEFAYKHLEIDGTECGGIEYLDIDDYVSALDFGYMNWVYELNNHISNN